MFRLLLMIGFIGAFSYLPAQDFITVKKKNGVPVKTFVQGSPITFETIYGDYVSGPIEILQNDSLFIRYYDIRRYPTSIGSVVIDTITTFLIKYHYNEIKRIKIAGRNRSFASKIDKLLMLGGAGYFALNIVNGAYFNESITSNKNLRSLGISLGAFGTGLIINKFFKPKDFTTRKQKIEYVKLG